MGKRAAAVPEIGETRLQVERDGVVNLVADPLAVEVRLQRVAFRRADDELVVDVAAIGGGGRGAGRRAPPRGGGKRWVIPPAAAGRPAPSARGARPPR